MSFDFEVFYCSVLFSHSVRRLLTWNNGSTVSQCTYFDWCKNIYGNIKKLLKGRNVFSYVPLHFMHKSDFFFSSMYPDSPQLGLIGALMLMLVYYMVVGLSLKLSQCFAPFCKDKRQQSSDSMAKMCSNEHLFIVQGVVCDCCVFFFLLLFSCALLIRVMMPITEAHFSVVFFIASSVPSASEILVMCTRCPKRTDSFIVFHWIVW